MSLLQETAAHCPYCGEPITLLVDGSVDEQHYVEDCEVCCRPIEVSVSIGPGGDASVRTERDDSA